VEGPAKAADRTRAEVPDEAVEVSVTCRERLRAPGRRLGHRSWSARAGRDQRGDCDDHGGGQRPPRCPGSKPQSGRP